MHSLLSYNDEKIGQGKETAKAYLKERPELVEELSVKIKAKRKEK